MFFNKISFMVDRRIRKDKEILNMAPSQKSCIIRFVSSIVKLLAPSSELRKTRILMLVFCWAHRGSTRPRGYKTRLKIKRDDWMLADTCLQAANHFALF